MSPPARTEVEVAGRRLGLSNRDKVLWPSCGFTKGDLIAYYQAVAATMVPHLQARPITLRRWPDGVDGETFFQKNAPKHRPEWIETVELGGVAYLRIDEPAALVWAANLAAIEIHPGLAPASHLDRPLAVVLDLDPGPPADVLDCARLAFDLRDWLGGAGLQLWPKTSGNKGLQLYAPTGGAVTFETARSFALGLARSAEDRWPDLVVSTIDPGQRRKKVLIDWAQNAPSRTTVAPYSVRALDRPSVSTPVTWDELDDAVSATDSSRLRFGPDQVLARIEQMGDLLAPMLTMQQELPQTFRS